MRPNIRADVVIDGSLLEGDNEWQARFFRERVADAYGERLSLSRIDLAKVRFHTASVNGPHFTLSCPLVQLNEAIEKGCSVRSSTNDAGHIDWLSGRPAVEEGPGRQRIANMNLHLHIKADDIEIVASGRLRPWVDQGAQFPRQTFELTCKIPLAGLLDYFLLKPEDRKPIGDAIAYRQMD